MVDAIQIMVHGAVTWVSSVRQHADGCSTAYCGRTLKKVSLVHWVGAGTSRNAVAVSHSADD